MDHKIGTEALQAVDDKGKIRILLQHLKFSGRVVRRKIRVFQHMKQLKLDAGNGKSIQVIHCCKDFFLSLPRQTEDQIIHLGSGITYASALPLAIATTCEDIELAIRFCDFLYTRQGFEYANYGVEGYDAAWVIPTGITLTAEETEEYSSRYSDIQTYVAESIPKFIMGELNLDSDWDSFVASVKTMGIERCCEIYQGAVARYNAR